MIELEHIQEQQSLVLRYELAVRRAWEACEAVPWDETRKRHLKDAREQLRSAKRTLEQMMHDYQDRYQMRLW